MIVLAIPTAATAFFFRETNLPAQRHAVSFSQAFTNFRGVISNRMVGISHRRLHDRRGRKFIPGDRSG
jgi:hypothetical protein